LANDLSLRYNAPVEITIEFERIEKDNIDRIITFPKNKALPITGSD